MKLNESQLFGIYDRIREEDLVFGWGLGSVAVDILADCPIMAIQSVETDPEEYSALYTEIGDNEKAQVLFVDDPCESITNDINSIDGADVIIVGDIWNPGQAIFEVSMRAKKNALLVVTDSQDSVVSYECAYLDRHPDWRHYETFKPVPGDQSQEQEMSVYLRIA